jgi:hypothetical protein
MSREISVGVSYEEHNLNESFYDWVLTAHDIIVTYLKWARGDTGPLMMINHSGKMITLARVC